MKWNKVTIPKKCGGLGIYKMFDKNFAFLCKWLWRYQNEDDPLWKRVINAKYAQ